MGVAQWFVGRLWRPKNTLSRTTPSLSCTFCRLVVVKDATQATVFEIEGPSFLVG